MSNEVRHERYSHDRARWATGLRICGLSVEQIASTMNIEPWEVRAILLRYGKNPDGEFKLKGDASMLNLPVWLVAQNVAPKATP